MRVPKTLLLCSAAARVARSAAFLLLLGPAEPDKTNGRWWSYTQALDSDKGMAFTTGRSTTRLMWRC